VFTLDATPRAADGVPSDARPVASARDAAPPERVAFEVASAVKAGVREIQVTLDPPELGRIDLSVDVDETGAVTTRLVVEKAETLDQLRRDAPNIEKLLEQQGLKTHGESLQFSLRDQGAGGREGRGERGKSTRATIDVAGVNAWRGPDPSLARAAARGGVDVRL
jgi:flagellar hook-length control protein FliK